MIGSKKLGVGKNWMDLYHCAKYDGNRRSRAGCRRSVMWYVCFFLWRSLW